MKVVLLGATGFVGSALLKEALDRGHRVTGIVRDPEKLEKRGGLIARTGDVYDTASLAGLIEGNDALISAFNPGWKNPHLYDDQVRGTRSIIEAAVIRLVNHHFLACWREIDPVGAKNRGLLSLMRRHRHNLKPEQELRLLSYLAQRPALEVITAFNKGSATCC